MTEVHTKRALFRPEKITTLFVGESVPHGGTFFYDANSKLFSAMKKAFENRDDFLGSFKAQGFFLDDLIPEPVNQLEREARQQLRILSIPSLAERIAEYKPEAIVIVMCAIKPMVLQAMQQAGVTYKPHITAFPSHGNQTRFHNEMTEIIPRLNLKGIK